MARPSQQTARRLSLLAAAQRAVAQTGVTKLRLKDVADAAGVTPASVLYYYGEGIEALLVALYRQSIARYAERRREVISAHESARDQLIASIRHGVPTGADDEDAKVIWQMDGFVGSDPLYDVLGTQQFEEQVSVYERVLAAGRDSGDFSLATDARGIARALVALEDGLGRQVLGGNPGIGRAEALRIIGVFASHAVGADIDPAETG
jgi:AcrR family transcriptional regulator